MATKQPQIVSIDGTEYDANHFTEEQVTLFNHCADLERKIGSTAFQLQQLHVGKDAFIRLLKTALEAPAEKVIAEEVN